MYAPVAQLDRVTGYEPVGRGFESLLAHHTLCPQMPDFTGFVGLLFFTVFKKCHYLAFDSRFVPSVSMSATVPSAFAYYSSNESMRFKGVDFLHSFAITY